MSFLEHGKRIMAPPFCLSITCWITICLVLFTGTCAGNCGNVNFCFCDAQCIDYGECCEDFLDESPDLYVI